MEHVTSHPYLSEEQARALIELNDGLEMFCGYAEDCLRVLLQNGGSS